MFHFNIGDGLVAQILVNSVTGDSNYCDSRHDQSVDDGADNNATR